MVSFRKWILALAVLAVFAGLASAQVNNTTLSCGANVSVTPALRSEGYTEQTGDIVISCTGGGTAVPGTQVPQTNIQVFLNTAVTSRLLPVSNVSNNISEALLLIDEPGAGQPPINLAGYGPSLGQTLCATPLSGCVEYVGTQAGVTLGTAVSGCTTFSAGGVCTATNATPGANVFQGVVNGNSVTFFGIPVLPPASSGVTRVFRITNIRANATALSGGSAAGATPVIASISTNGATSLNLGNPTPTVGFVQAGLTATAAGASNFNQCNSSTRAAVSILTFAENFPTAFKTRVFAQSNSSYAGQVNTFGGAVPPQNIPGTVYFSESNLVVPVNASQTAGLADYGTRVKAQFNNVPAGVRLFVSTTNVNNNALPIAAPAVIGGSAANNSTFAQLVQSETVNDGNAGTAGFFPSVSSTDVPSVGNTPIVEIPVVNGSATAVWEVVNTNPTTNESFKVGVYSTYSSNVAQNSPPPGTATVNLSFAPTPPAFTAASGAAASSTLTIPRFIADTSAARNLFNVNICRTVLLYPYVTNVLGFDTGLAIANTSTDPFGTGAQAGACTLNWYQGTSNPAQGNTGSIASGTVYTTLASIAAPGFNGYMIAVCNFQYAHGFAFVSDLGARNLAMGYLALVIPDPGTGSRNASPACQGITGCSSTGENEGH